MILISSIFFCSCLLLILRVIYAFYETRTLFYFFYFWKTSEAGCLQTCQAWLVRAMFNCVIKLFDVTLYAVYKNCVENDMEQTRSKSFFPQSHTGFPPWRYHGKIIFMKWVIRSEMLVFDHTFGFRDELARLARLILLNNIDAGFKIFV